MVNSYVYYTGDGSTTNFQITFDYLSKEFVQVYLDGVPLAVETDYIFAGDRTIVTTSIPASGSVVFIRRVTSKNRLVEFRDASILVANDLDISALQAIHIAEEANDNIQNVIQADSLGNFDVLNRRLVGVGDPVDDTDGTNKLYVDTRFAADVSAAVAARDAAMVAQGLSENARDAAQGFANIADVRATQASGSAIVAAQSAQEAQAAADSIGVMQSRGVLLSGQDTITLTWTYNPTLKNIAVYLDGVKQDADTALIYTDAYTITLTEPVTEATNWEVISVTLAGDSILSGYVDQAQTIVNNAALSNLPVGFFGWHTGTTPPAGWVQADGLLKSRAAFPDLWAYAQTCGNYVADDALWDAGRYSGGDGSTTFRVPKVDDRFIRGKSATRNVGLVEEDAFQGHRMGPLSGTGFATTINSGGGYTGAVGATLVNRSTTGDPVTDSVNGTPRTADETRPKALTMLPCIKAYDVISDPNVLNAVGVVNEISRLESEKLRKDENINLGVSVAASGTAVDFVGIPEGVKRITVMFNGVSTNGTSVPLVQIGTGGDVHSSSYLGAAGNHGSGTPATALYTTGFAFCATPWAAPISVQGSAVLSMSSNTCFWSAMMGRNDTGGVLYGGGTRSISGPVDRIRITTVNGTDVFDAGTINISWEF